MSAPTLLELLAQRRGITPEQARKVVAAATIPASRRALMPLLEKVFPDMFRIDWSAITNVGNCRTMAQVEQAVEVFRYRSKGDHSWLRMRLGFRVSGRRLLTFAAREFGATNAPADSAS